MHTYACTCTLMHADGWNAWSGSSVGMHMYTSACIWIHMDIHAYACRVSLGWGSGRAWLAEQTHHAGGLPTQGVGGKVQLCVRAGIGAHAKHCREGFITSFDGSALHNGLARADSLFSDYSLFGGCELKWRIHFMWFLLHNIKQAKCRTPHISTNYIHKTHMERTVYHAVYA